MTGMAFGAGSGIAHAAVNSVLGGGGGGGGEGGAPAEGGNESYSDVSAPADGGYNDAAEDPCADYYSSLMQCMKMNSTDIGACQYYSDIFSKCQNREGDFAHM